MNNVEFSIIIPAYNAEKTILQTVNSVLHQSYRKWELIVVIDGAIDSTEKICRQTLKNIENSKIIIQKNKGVSSARNNGLKNAKGNYVIFLDSDDLLHKSLLEIYAQYIYQSIEESLNFCCNSLLIDEQNNEIGKELKGVTKAYQILEFQNGFSTCPSGYVFNRYFLEKHVILYNKLLSNTADKDFILKCLIFGKIININQKLMYYRVTSMSMSNNLSTNLIIDYTLFRDAVKVYYLGDLKPFISRIHYICAGIQFKLKNYRSTLLFLIKSLTQSPKTFLFNLYGSLC